ncbi:23342_t:CDS:2, partial [Racocetra persica]
MHSLITIKTPHEVIKLLDNLEKYNIKTVTDWVRDKKQTWVLVALLPAFTKMSYDIWINSPFTTNA